MHLRNGAFLVVNTGAELRRSDQGLLTTLGWTDANGVDYCLEGSLFNAGTVVQWLRDGLGLIDNAAQIRPRQSATPQGRDAGQPSLVGHPHGTSARGLLIGLTRDSNRGHIARAALEGIALSVANLVCLAEQALGHSLGELAVDGKLPRRIRYSSPSQQHRPAGRGDPPESTARGVALLAGVQAGVINDLHDLVATRSQGAELFTPTMDADQRERCARAGQRGEAQPALE